MNNNDIVNMSAKEIMSTYNCSTLYYFEDLFDYEINKQYGENANSSSQ